MLGYLASLYLGIPSGASSCAGLTMENELSLMAPFHFIRLVIVMAIGITYDILMIRFMAGDSLKILCLHSGSVNLLS